MENLKQKLLSLDIFIDNEYLDFYCSLIEQNIQTESQKGLTERHHKIPRKVFKLLDISVDNSRNNLVNLTHFDHCLAHYYLCLCTKGQLKYASEHSFIRMSKIKTRFKDFDFDNFLNKATEYNDVYKSFTQHQSELNKKSCEKRGGKGTNAGKHSYTNGVINVFAYECPEGFWPGRLKAKATEEQKLKYKESAKKRCQDPAYVEKLAAPLKKYYEEHGGTVLGKVWITNDIEDRYINKDAILPDGWRYGRKKFTEQAKENIRKGHLGLKWKRKEK